MKHRPLNLKSNIPTPLPITSFHSSSHIIFLHRSPHITSPRTPPPFIHHLQTSAFIHHFPSPPSIDHLLTLTPSTHLPLHLPRKLRGTELSSFWGGKLFDVERKMVYRSEKTVKQNFNLVNLSDVLSVLSSRPHQCQNIQSSNHTKCSEKRRLFVNLC